MTEQTLENSRFARYNRGKSITVTGSAENTPGNLTYQRSEAHKAMNDSTSIPDSDTNTPVFMPQWFKSVRSEINPL